MDGGIVNFLTEQLSWRETVAIALIFLALERIAPIDPAQKILRSSWVNDVYYLIFNQIPIKLGSALLIGGMLIALSSLVPESVGLFVRAQPFWAQIVALIILGDIGFYMAHRISHAVPFLWRFHALHHSIVEMDWLAGHRVHPLDQILSNFMKFLPLVLLGFSVEAMVASSIFYAFHATLLHSNFKFSLGPLDRILAMPRFHHWHHANEPEAYGYNYGGQLLLLDWLFGTLRVPTGFPDRYGTYENVPGQFARQMIWPFRFVKEAPQEVRKDAWTMVPDER
jgi:sterol desaturase/sphingolipid hydroxylase (fatty acid hydroxylase superfamily)